MQVHQPVGTAAENYHGRDRPQDKDRHGSLPWLPCALVAAAKDGAALIDGGLNSIDIKKLPRDPNNGCSPVFPWAFVRANSIFSVIHRAGGYAEA